MNLNDYRKKIFLNSQYCTYYNESKGTVLAGIMRSFGYRYSVILPDEKLKEINRIYRKFTSIMNLIVAVEILLYIYFIIFPYYTEFMKLPFFASVLVLSILPLIVLYFTYIGINYIYENYLTRYVGTFQKTKFQPKLTNIDEKAFQNYKKTPQKSVFVLLILVIIFSLYAFIPYIIKSLNINQKYDGVLKLTNAYLAFVPVAPDVYAQRAYAKFNLKQYKAAEKDYELANKYSLSENFSDDILGVKTYYLPKNEMLKEFDNAINAEKEEPFRYLLEYEKASYLMKNKDYNAALNIFNKILNAYENQTKVFFSPAKAYYSRGVAKKFSGDSYGADTDIKAAEVMCPDCKFNFETTLIVRP